MVSLSPCSEICSVIAKLADKGFNPFCDYDHPILLRKASVPALLTRSNFQWVPHAGCRQLLQSRLRDRCFFRARPRRKPVIDSRTQRIEEQQLSHARPVHHKHEMEKNGRTRNRLRVYGLNFDYGHALGPYRVVFYRPH
jgi:hypothetical protein